MHCRFAGDIKDVSIPLDNTTGKHRGFGFVEYESRDDAAAATDNMHNGELYGRIMRVNYAQPMKIKGGDKGWSHQAVWADADDWCALFAPLRIGVEYRPSYAENSTSAAARTKCMQRFGWNLH